MGKDSYQTVQLMEYVYPDHVISWIFWKRDRLDRELGCLVHRDLYNRGV